MTAYGHENVMGTHPTTIEVTKDRELTKRGDCIIGVRASHALSDLREELLNWRGSQVKVTITVDGFKEIVSGFVHPSLEFTDTRAIILRKSSFLCPRTLLVQADKAAKDLNREMMEKMRNPEQEIIIEIERSEVLVLRRGGRLVGNI